MEPSLPPTERVRLELERAIPHHDAARAMLLAVSASGARAPETEAELAAFVDGPVRSALERIYSAARAGELTRALHEGLAARHEHPDDRPTPVHELDGRITGRIPLARQRPVPVLVVARTDALANRLAVVARSERATVVVRGDVAGIERAIAHIPLVVVLDAVDPPDAPAESVVTALCGLPQHVQWIVRGSDRAVGRELAMLAELAGRTVNSLREEDGLGPLVDVILSRRA